MAKRGRDAKTGQFVKISYANKHKATTIIETVRPKQTKPKKK